MVGEVTVENTLRRFQKLQSDTHTKKKVASDGYFHPECLQFFLCGAVSNPKSKIKYGKARIQYF